MSPTFPVPEIAASWLEQGRRVVAATLVEVMGSAPLNPGATMVIDGDGKIEGSVTGGCVESALAEEARRVLRGDPAHISTFGISDELAGTVGLMCGGTVRILVAELDQGGHPVLSAAAAAVDENRPLAIATVLDGASIGNTMAVVDEEAVGDLGVTELLDRSVKRDSVGLIAQGVSMIRRYGADGATMGNELGVFIHAFTSAPRMIIFGAIDFSVALARLAREIGYEVTICDAREAFVASTRFSEAAEVVSQWPDAYMEGRKLGERDAVLVFTHDPKFDEPAILSALETDAGYIGALGSRKTDQDRRERLRRGGASEAQLERLVSPCGLDIGSSTPAETAVAILAEITTLRSGRHGARLVETSGPIRRRPDVRDSA